MTGTSTACRRDIARLLALCAVLFGLFLMHGAPATAAEGCHGAPGTAPMPEGHAAAGMGSATPPAMLHAGAQQASKAASMDGTLCISTSARKVNPLPTPCLLAVIAVLATVLMAGRTVAPGRTGRRAPPPPGGRGLLLQVCIART